MFFEIIYSLILIAILAALVCCFWIIGLLRSIQRALVDFQQMIAASAVEADDSYDPRTRSLDS